MLSISRYRVQNIGRRYLLDGDTPKERRGGDTLSTKFQQRREGVKSFISQLHFIESHYTREKSCRKYLPSDSTIKKLWRAYNNKVDQGLRVKYVFFLRIFNYDFNISFKSPATDACSECIRLKALIPVTTSQPQKQEYMARLTVHKMRYQSFYSMLKQDDGPTVLKLSFDCQKNLVLPRIPDQAAYYSRQLYLYNFSICVGHSKAPQDKDSVFTYTWCENQRFKGSNEIASILYYHLQNTDLTGINEIKLYCDGCPGQNKNVTVLGMLCRFLFESVGDLRKILITFPVVGHSFIPPDRVFGRIEKEIRKKDTIIEPQDYIDLFVQYGTVRKVGSEVPIFDWKTAVNSVLKAPGQFHFKFAASKRIVIDKNVRGVIRVQGEANYRNDLCTLKTIQKKGKILSQIVPEPLANRVPVNPLKLRDVDNLLSKHFGENWKTQSCLKYYVDALNSLTEEEVPDGQDQILDDAVDFIEEDDTFSV